MKPKSDVRVWGSSGTRDEAGILSVIARFYCTTPDRITLTQSETEPGAWEIRSGEKPIEGCVVRRRRNRYSFETR